MQSARSLQQVPNFPLCNCDVEFILVSLFGLESEHPTIAEITTIVTKHAATLISLFFKFLANVKEHAPPPLESESAATEELHGGCCVSSCSESSFGDAAKSISENLARAVNAATQSAFQQVGERLKHQPPPGQDRSASEPNVPYRK